MNLGSWGTAASREKRRRVIAELEMSVTACSDRVALFEKTGECVYRQAIERDRVWLVERLK